MASLHFGVEIVLSDLVAYLRIRRTHLPQEKRADVRSERLIGRRWEPVQCGACLVDVQVVAAVYARAENVLTGCPATLYRNLPALEHTSNLIAQRVPHTPVCAEGADLEGVQNAFQVLLRRDRVVPADHRAQVSGVSVGVRRVVPLACCGQPLRRGALRREHVLIPSGAPQVRDGG